MPAILNPPPSPPMAPTSILSAAGEGLLIGLLTTLSISMLIGLGMILISLARWARCGRIFLPAGLSPGDYADEEMLDRLEADHLDDLPQFEIEMYNRAKEFFRRQTTPANTDLTSIDMLNIQEKGVLAWEFCPEVERVGIMVQSRTEIEFSDTMPCSVLTNYPVPKTNEHYYWEAKLMELSEPTIVSIGMSSKPYPAFRLPGYHCKSFAFQSDGKLFVNQQFEPTHYSLRKNVQKGDVIGVGYQPRTGSIFYTHNGMRYGTFSFSRSINWFPTIGATGPCQVHVNLGQLGFVFIEANVKRWGFAPMCGTLSPPPAYGRASQDLLVGTSYSGVGATLPSASNSAQASLAEVMPPEYNEVSASTTSESRTKTKTKAKRPKDSLPLSPPVGYEDLMAQEQSADRHAASLAQRASSAAHNNITASS